GFFRVGLGKFNAGFHIRNGIIDVLDGLFPKAAFVRLGGLKHTLDLPEREQGLVHARLARVEGGVGATPAGPGGIGAATARATGAARGGRRRDGGGRGGLRKDSNAAGADSQGENEGGETGACIHGGFLVEGWKALQRAGRPKTLPETVRYHVLLNPAPRR